MSKTDKTRPSWVKLRDDYRARMEIHDHTDGVCNFDNWDANLNGNWTTWPRKCGYTVNYYSWHNGFFPRGSARWLKAEIRLRHGAARARLRKDTTEIRKLAIEDMDDYDIINPRPRNGALWECY
jgi:hypothetical protein